MNKRNLSIGFMIFMAIAFIAIIGLFLKLQNVTKVSNLRADEIAVNESELEAMQEVRVANTAQIKILNNFRTLAMDRCPEIAEKYPKLTDVPAEITEEELSNNDLWDQLNVLSFGVSYESKAKLDAAETVLGDRNYEFFYVKQVNNLSASYVIYYNSDLADTAEGIAEELKKVDPGFKAIKGQTPGSISQADKSNTILIHING